MTDALTWNVSLGESQSVATFSIPGEVLGHDALQHIALPPELTGREHLGLILSGRGPIWLYCHLTHLAHPYAWVAVNDPRLNGAVLVQRHHPDAPALGSIRDLEESRGSRSSTDVAVEPIVPPFSESQANGVIPPVSPWRPDERQFSLKPADSNEPHRTTRWQHFPWQFVLAVLLSALALHGVALDVWHWLHGLSHAWSIPTRSILGVAGLGAFVWTAYLAHRHRFRAHGRFVVSCAAVLAMCSFFVALASHDLVTGFVNEMSIRVVVLICLAAAGLFWMTHEEERLPRRTLNQFLVSGNEATSQPQKEVKHLIIPLTAPNWIPYLPEIDEGFSQVTFRGKGLEQGLSLTGANIAADIATMNEIPTPSNWQQLLRGLQPHIQTIEHVWLFGSDPISGARPDEVGGTLTAGMVRDSESPPPPAHQPVATTLANARGSATYLARAAMFIQRYLLRNTQITIYRNADETKQLQFQNFGDIEQVIGTILHDIHGETPRAKTEVVIDTTGGLKTTSIAGAVATLRGDAVFQYVDTGGGNPVYVYDLKFEQRPQTGA